MQHGPLWKCFSPHWKKYSALCAFGKTASVLLELWPYVENMSQVKTFLNESATMVVLVQVCESKQSQKMKDNVFQRPTNQWQLFFYPLHAVVKPIYTPAVQLARPPRTFKGFISTLSVTTRCLFSMSRCYDWLACTVPLHIGSSLSPPALSALHLTLLVRAAYSQKPLIC